VDPRWRTSEYVSYLIADDESRIDGGWDRVGVGAGTGEWEWKYGIMTFSALSDNIIPPSSRGGGGKQAGLRSDL
jgi:hypothetical protein